jgi:hypothetical protein
MLKSLNGMGIGEVTYTLKPAGPAVTETIKQKGSCFFAWILPGILEVNASHVHVHVILF